MIGAILTDIEGTTSSISFVHDVLFPYARENIDSLVVKGGFPPIMLAPVNFEALYQQAMARAAEEGQQAAAEQPATH